MADWPDGTVAARYEFLHALYQEVTYARVPAGRQARLHQRIGERAEQGYGARAAEIAAELAVHFERGRDYHRAVRYLQLAGENAARRSAYQEAISQLTKGLELLKTLPDTPERVRQEIALQIALGHALLASKGYAAPEVEKTHTRALELCRQVGETLQLIFVLGRLVPFYQNRGEFQTARELAEQMMQLAQRAQDPHLFALAHARLGSTLYYLGELTSARTLLEQGSALYDPHQHPYFIVDTANPKLDCLAIVSRSLLLLGYPEQGLKRSQEAVAVARGLSYPFGLAIALGEAALFHLHCRDGQGAREWAEAVMTLATEQGFPHWVAYGTLVRGWVLAEQCQVLEGIAQMRQSQVSFSAPHVLPEAYGKAGQVEKGLAMLAKALAFVDKTGTRAHEAELHRVKGELILQSSVQCPASRAKQAEACFLKAIDIARRQSAKLLELRAVMCLSRLWQQQGKRQEARNLLAEIYGWFTEGFDTKDLQEARALLEELT